eukprot:gene7157-11470_t
MEEEDKEEILFVNKLPKYFQCPICFEHLEEVVSTPCHHKFCKSCLLKTYNLKNKCPICRRNIHIEDCSYDVWMNNEINSLDVFCGKRLEGCQWKGPLSDLKHHKLKSCQYSQVLCPNGCKQKILRINFENHNENCKYRLIQCEYCNSSIKFGHKVRHERSCSNFPLKCELCSNSIERCKMETHFLNDCLLVEIECPFGCNKRLLRKDLDVHNEESIEIHLNKMLNQVIQLKKENEILKNSMQIHVTNDEIKLTDEPICNLPVKYSWNFHRIFNSTQNSPHFKLNGAIWNFSVNYNRLEFDINLNLIKGDHSYSFDTYWTIQIENVMKTKIISKQNHFKFDILNDNLTHTSHKSITLNNLEKDGFIDDFKKIHFKFIFTKMDRELLMDFRTPQEEENVLWSDSDDTSTENQII